MSTTAEEVEQLRARAARAFQKATAEQVIGRLRAIIGPTAQEGLVRDALSALQNGELPTPMQMAALEQAIRVFRPSLLSKGGQLPPLSPEVGASFPDWEGFRAAVKPLLPSVGRIELMGPQGKQRSVGTGFLVRPHLLVTNRHVLEELSSGTGKLERGMARVNFGQEYGQVDAEGPVDIVREVAEHPDLDLALLEVDTAQLSAARTPLELETEAVGRGADVAVIGYPFPDAERNPSFVTAAFEGKLGVKRVAPGEVMKTAGATLHHDCSTLGGNSGSPLVSLKSARVVGVHFRGSFAVRNTAVAASELGAFLQAHAPQ
ncbi:trypsin-like serine peptidase [Pyxidicoccus xibeiensis]|uniref:trypsin-like serine peptidase n=1 Tax=Pyxidicoccus xibeiensis TaxID=2906759 RepID=UPI0020A809C0|nr:serine protease [Pyxidicoccus xibeiensis]MCP3139260.1 serine protease [Pyxidicoccus xibeiensis]